jgi:uncharacterized protein
MHRHSPDCLNDARYARLRSFRGDGAPVDTPVWFAMDAQQLVFRTKVGPKTRWRANRALHRRYGWRWNIVPLVKVPVVTNVHRGLCFGEKLRRSRDHEVWSDSVIVRVELTNA